MSIRKTAFSGVWGGGAVRSVSDCITSLVFLHKPGKIWLLFSSYFSKIYLNIQNPKTLRKNDQPHTASFFSNGLQ